MKAGVGLAAMLAAAVGGCGISSQSWNQIAMGTAQVLGETKYDPQVASASAKIAKYCGALQAVAAAGTIFAPEAQRKLAAQAAAAVNSLCSAPPQNVAEVGVAVAKAYDAVVAAGRAADVGVPSL